ncbi:PREDICTED: uncharacterized protein LOC106127153 [Papilio xuthus]|uniref:Uncharacterized protein LOC106127153 n=1 Tax=Papilio xuthus TaxID=66420 RepID=A0AAJ6ZWP5_PAPXU|nr:PREDICTED: uncharacterized protein LOC106127153 [Papilio xuthus]
MYTRINHTWKMDDEKLIETVRKYEFIYNLKHPRSMDNAKKEIAWNEIGEQLNQSAIACKQRWQCLRDSFRRALKHKRDRGEAAKGIKPWKYEKEMAFVAPFFMEKKSKNSVEITSEDDLSYNAQVSYGTEALENYININIEDPLANNDSDEVINNKSWQKKSNKKLKAVKRKAAQSVSSASPVLTPNVSTFDDEKNVEPVRGHDELDRFFLNISDTVKKFSPYLQALAKNKIFSIVSEMELQQFQMEVQTTTPFTFKASPQSESPTPVPTTSDDWTGDQKLQYLS